MIELLSNRLIKSQRHAISRYLLALILVLSSSLLLAQSIELGHSHEDLQSQLDCQICFKHSSKGKVLLTSGFSLDLQAGTGFTLEQQPSQPSLDLPARKSRAPPVLLTNS